MSPKLKAAHREYLEEGLNNELEPMNLSASAANDMGNTPQIVTEATLDVAYQYFVEETAPEAAKAIEGYRGKLLRDLSRPAIPESTKNNSDNTSEIVNAIEESTSELFKELDSGSIKEIKSLRSKLKRFIKNLSLLTIGATAAIGVERGVEYYDQVNTVKAPITKKVPEVLGRFYYTKKDGRHNRTIRAASGTKGLNCKQETVLSASGKTEDDRVKVTCTDSTSKKTCTATHGSIDQLLKDKDKSDAINCIKKSDAINSNKN